MRCKQWNARAVQAIFAKSAVSHCCHAVIEFHSNSAFSHSSAYEKIHKELETCALVVKTRIECIEILKEEVNTNDEQRVYSAYKSLVEIYMNGTNIDRSWWAFFRQAFETVVGDSGIRNHNQVFIKYLKLLRNLKEFEPLLNSSIRMLELYPTEYIPMDMICWVNINKYQSQDLSVKVSVRF